MIPKIAPMLMALLAMPSFANAQDHRNGPPPPRAEFARLQQHTADDIALLLSLRPAQRPALTAFLASMAPPERPDGDRPGRDPAARVDRSADGFPQQLQRMTEMTARHSADATKRIAAARSFYDGLDPQQRAAFEALMRLRQGPPMIGPAMMGPPMIGPAMMGPPMMGPPMMGSPMTRPMQGGPMRDGPGSRPAAEAPEAG